VGGMMELVRDRVTGLLVPPAAPERLAAAITEVIEDPELRDRMIAAAHEQVMRNNRVEVTTRRAELLYEQIIARAGADSPTAN
jgi:glycosyltransferase involved in cell wall biosynthesis